jgi:hypothetical protein
MVVVASTMVALAMFVEWHVLKISWLDAIGLLVALLRLVEAFLLLHFKHYFTRIWTFLFVFIFSYFDLCVCND